MATVNFHSTFGNIFDRKACRNCITTESNDLIATEVNEK